MPLDLSKCYRAKVTNNNYKKAPAKVPLGSVEVFVPDWNAEKVVGKGKVWAAPIDAAFTGSDASVKKIGQCIIPAVNTYVWVAIEDGNYSKAYYFGSYPVKTDATIPYENQQLGKPYDAFTILKTPKGRCIVVVDDGSDKKGGIAIKGKTTNEKNKILGDANQMAIIMSENTWDGIIIQTGRGKQDIVIDKSNNKTKITQGSSSILLTDHQITIEADVVNVIGRNRINLN